MRTAAMLLLPVAAALAQEQPEVHGGKTLRAWARLAEAAFEEGPERQEAVAKQAVPALREAMRSPDERTREIAIESLAWLGPAARGAVPDLARMLRSDHTPRGLRGAVLLALGEIGPDAVAAVQPLLAMLGEDEQWAWAAETLAKICPAAVPALVEAFAESDDPELRARIVRALSRARRRSRLGKERALVVRAFAATFDEEDPHVRRAALGELAMLDPSRPDLFAILLDAEGDRVLRRHLAEELLSPEPPLEGVFPRLLKRLLDPAEDPEVRRRIANHLAVRDVPPPPAATLRDLRTALHAGEVAERRRAARVLMALHPEDAETVAALMRALGDEDGPVRRRAAQALGAIGSGARLALLPLLRMLRSEQPMDRAYAAYNLGRVGAEAALIAPVLAERVRQEEEDLRVRSAAVQGLGEMGAGAVSAVPALVEALAERALERDAARALGRIGPGARVAVPALFRAARTTTDPAAAIQALRSVRRISDDPELVLAPLLKLLDPEQPVLFEMVCEALGELGPAAADALPHLRALAETGSRRTRAAARAALERIDR